MIPNGIELTEHSDTPDLRQMCGVPPGTPLVGCVARLSEQKGIDVLLPAWQLAAREVPDAHFLLIGDGPLGPMVAERTAGWRGFTWLSGVPDVRRVLHQLDVFSLLSRYEGAPYAPLEAMWAGVPAVLSDVVGNRDAVDVASGVLVPAEDAGDAAAAIVTLLRRPDLRRQLSDAGRSRVVDRFDIRKIANMVTGLYQEVTGHPQSLS